MRSLPPGPHAAPPHPTPELREALGILRRNRLMLVAFPLFGIAMGLFAASLRSPSYEASALLLVGSQPPSDLSATALQSSQPDAQLIGTEMEMLRSRRLAREVVDSLDLQVTVLEPRAVPRSSLFRELVIGAEPQAATYRIFRRDDGRFTVTRDEHAGALGTIVVAQPVDLGGVRLALGPAAGRYDQIVIAVETTAKAIRDLEAGIDVAQPGTEVNAIRVSYRGADPELVRDVPNVLAARYVAMRESVQKAEARSTAVFLREQLDTIARQLALSEEQLRGFREANRVIDPQMEANSQVAQLAELQATRAALDAERSSLASLYGEVRRTAGPERAGTPSPYRRLVAFPTLIQNQTAAELLKTLSEVENERASLSTRRSAEDPEIIALNARVAEIERQLQGVVTTYLQGITNQVSAMDASLGQYRAQLAEMPAKEIQFARLSRQPRVLQSMYEVLQTRLKEAEIAEAVEDASIRIVDPADLPSEPVGGAKPIFAGLAGFLGLVAGVGLIFAREYADKSVHTRADVQAAVGIPVLGMIPQTSAPAAPRRKLLPRRSRAGDLTEALDGGRLLADARSGTTLPALYVTGSRAPTPWSDAYLRLHTNVMFAQPDASMKTLLFTSPLPGDGKTSTAVNFAITLAQSGLKVLLIDADLRRGRVHELFNADATPGLSDLLSDSPVPGVLRTADVGGGRPLRYIASGRTPANPVQLLSSAGMRALVECAAAEYDRVIIDSPPVNLFPDAVPIGSLADGVVVVARAGVTPFDALVDASEQLRHSNTPVIGAVLNGIDFERDVSYDTSYRWYGYRKGYAQATAGV